MRILGLLVCVACLVALVGGCEKASPLQAKKLTLTEFEALVKDKSAGEVLAAVGKPDRVQKAATAEFWYYDRAAIDPATKKASRATLLFGKDGAGPCQMFKWN